ncbi:G-protein coupled receptor 22-like [Asterias rubens]|uniref:G-protein coupled receptor 22-like n=1 Tax=Asterias rubens TaxID=7604 RepID=UPI001454F8B9|nr:G-protein coupled receptor 22-like [Asterias rubens]
MADPTAATTDNMTALDGDVSYVYPVPYVVILSIVLVTEMIAGILSNTAVLFSYHVNRKFIRSVSDVFIINMNIVDIIICVVSIPATLVAVLSYPGIPLFCFFHEATVSFAGVASAVNVVVISIDRYDKISHPLVRRFNMRNVRWILPITWVLSLLGFCSPFIGINLNKFKEVQNLFNVEQHLCFHWFFRSRDNHFYELYYIPIFFVATIVMIRAYYGIIRITRVKTIHTALVKATVTVKLQDNRRVIAAANNLRDPEKRVSRTTTIIILTFIICWGPHALISIVILARGYANSGDVAVEMVERWLVALGYTTTLMHPILYVFMRRNFRRAFFNSWIARCLARQGVFRANTPSQSHDRTPRVVGHRQTERRQSQTRRFSRPVNKVQVESNVPQTSGIKVTARTHVTTDEERVEKKPMLKRGEDALLLRADDVENNEPIIDMCNDVTGTPATVKESDDSVFVFREEDVKLRLSGMIAGKTQSNNNLPSVD